jgi:hypothetical protein
MFKTRALGAVLVVLALSGCSAESEESAPAAESAAPTATPGPIELPSSAATPEATEAPSGVIEDGEAIFLESSRKGLHGMDDVSDAQLLATGYYACDLVAAGESPDDVDVISGSAAGEPVPEWNDAALAGLATQTLCVEYDITKSQ